MWPRTLCGSARTVAKQVVLLQLPNPIILLHVCKFAPTAKRGHKPRDPTPHPHARTHPPHTQAVVLEMIGDLPEADVKPPTSVLFVCKLNQVTSEVRGGAWLFHPIRKGGAKEV